MNETDEGSRSTRVILFFMGYIFVGMVLAFFWNLGWLLLTGALLRLSAYIVLLNRGLYENYGGIIWGKNRTSSEKAFSKSPGEIVSKIVGIMMSLAWVAISIFIIIKVNAPIILILRMISK